MQRAVLIPLIVACALFMENMDSTVITTSLPAIAADIGENPLALKLALTSYLVEPRGLHSRSAAGSRIAMARAPSSRRRSSCSWADRCCAPRRTRCRVRHRALPAGHRRRDDGAGRAPGADARGAEARLRRRAQLPDDSGAARPGHRPGARRRDHAVLPLALDLPDQRPDRHPRHLFLVLRHIPNVREADIPRIRPARIRAARRSGSRCSMLGFSALGGHLLPDADHRGVHRGRRRCTVRATCGTRGASQHPVIDLRLFRVADVLRTASSPGSLFRIGVGATPFLLPLLFQIGFGLNPLQSGLLTCATAVGAMFMKTMTVYDPEALGISHRADGQRRCSRPRSSSRLRALHRARRRTSIIAAVLLAVRMPALAAVHGAERASRSPTSRREDMSQATSISSMAQRLAQSVGIAVGAYVLQISSARRVTRRSWRPTFGRRSSRSR